MENPKIVLYEEDKFGAFTGASTKDNQNFIIQQKSILGNTKEVYLSKRQLEQILKCEEVHG